MRSLSIILATALLVGCKEAPRSASVNSWDELQQVISSEPSILDTQQATALIPYDSIKLDRGPCLGNCPVYSVTFHRNGEAFLTDDYLLPEKSVKYSAHISLRDFARLAQSVHAAQVAADQSEYEGQWRDDYSADITVTDKNGAWSVRDYGQVAPYQVWALEELLHSKRMSLEWKRLSQ